MLILIKFFDLFQKV